MDPGGQEGAIAAELEKTCAQEAIHLLGTVQSYGFLMVVDMASRCIIQVVEGITRHWPGLQNASVLIATPLSDWVAGVDHNHTLTIESLPASGPVVLSWRLRFERTDALQAPPVATGIERTEIRFAA